jgi:hypothetical protein
MRSSIRRIKLNQEEMNTSTEEIPVFFAVITVIISLVIVFGLLVVGFINYLNEPIVAVSWETKECRYVEFSDGHREDCGDLSKLGGYEQIWVK